MHHEVGMPDCLDDDAWGHAVGTQCGLFQHDCGGQNTYILGDPSVNRDKIQKITKNKSLIVWAFPPASEMKPISVILVQFDPVARVSLAVNPARQPGRPEQAARQVAASIQAGPPHACCCCSLAASRSLSSSISIPIQLASLPCTSTSSSSPASHHVGPPLRLPPHRARDPPPHLFVLVGAQVRQPHDGVYRDPFGPLSTRALMGRLPIFCSRAEICTASSLYAFASLQLLATLHSVDTE